jgi:recombination protein RecA
LAQGHCSGVGDLAHTNIDVLPTGISVLDHLLGIGGWPRGPICEVFGPDSVGATTLLLQSLAEAQQRGGIVAFVDVDHAFVPEYACRIGCRVEEIFKPSLTIGRWPLEVVDALVRSGTFDLIALDSVPGLHSARGDGDDPSNTAGEALARARLLSEAMRRLAADRCGRDDDQLIVVQGSAGVVGNFQRDPT